MTRNRCRSIVSAYYRRYIRLNKSKDVLLTMVKEYRQKICPAICRYNFAIKRGQIWRLCEELGKSGWYMDEKDCPGYEHPREAEIVANAFLRDLYEWSDRLSWSQLLFINCRYHCLRAIIIDLIALED